MKILVIHGPNLHLLGTREPSIYGRANLSTINQDLKRLATHHRVALTALQSNHEGEIVELIGRAKKRYDALIINPAAYTHTSVAIRDAIEAAGIPAVEVHLSNIYAREPFRHQSLIAPVCRGVVCGFGPSSYRVALEAVLALLSPSEQRPRSMTSLGQSPSRARIQRPRRKLRGRRTSAHS